MRVVLRNERFAILRQHHLESDLQVPVHVGYADDVPPLQAWEQNKQSQDELPYSRNC